MHKPWRLDGWNITSDFKYCVCEVRRGGEKKKEKRKARPLKDQQTNENFDPIKLANVRPQQSVHITSTHDQATSLTKHPRLQQHGRTD
jgi:hypothetical protein